ncbi:MAG: hypothetical protein GC200_08395 [Tepidisphaera sp.]|nr:hypothetical protein [Tepidisphaera sp.]
MLVLNPSSVTFGSATWSNVTALVIERAAQKQVTEWSDNGPHAVLADVPEQVVKVRVVSEVVSGDPNGPSTGASGVLTATTGPNASDALRRVISIAAVVVGVSYELSQKKGAVRTVDLVAVSSDGASDPVSVTDA